MSSQALPEQPIDPPEEDDFEARMEAIEAAGEAAFEMWRADGYPERGTIRWLKP